MELALQGMMQYLLLLVSFSSVFVCFVASLLNMLTGMKKFSFNYNEIQLTSKIYLLLKVSENEYLFFDA